MHHTVPYPPTEPRTETGHQSRILPALRTVATAISRWEWLRLFLTPSPLRFGQRPSGPGTANCDQPDPYRRAYADRHRPMGRQDGRLDPGPTPCSGARSESHRPHAVAPRLVLGLPDSYLSRPIQILQPAPQPPSPRANETDRDGILRQGWRHPPAVITPVSAYRSAQSGCC